MTDVAALAVSRASPAETPNHYVVDPKLSKLSNVSTILKWEKKKDENKTTIE